MAGHALAFRSLDLQDGDSPELSVIWFDLFNPFEPAEVAGEDLVIPQKPGMTEMTRIKLRRLHELRGHVRGMGDTRAERSESFYTGSQALRAVMDMDQPSGIFEWLAPYLGLPSGSLSILARCVDAVPGPILNSMSFQRWSIRLLTISDPPEWEEES